MAEITMKSSFKLSKEDKPIYEEHGEIISELVEEQDYKSALKIVNKILKKKNDCSFALFYKASILFADFAENLNLPEIESFEDIEETIEILNVYVTNLKDAIKSLDMILKSDKNNKDVKKLKIKIETNLEEIEETIKNGKKQLKNTGSSGEIKARFSCPYCDSDEDTYDVKNSVAEYECHSCGKQFRALVGTVRAVRGLGSRYSGLVTIRYTKVEGGEDVINYNKKFSGYDIRQRDLFCLIYKKGFLGGYSSQPHSMINWTLGQLNTNL